MMQETKTSNPDIISEYLEFQKVEKEWKKEHEAKEKSKKHLETLVIEHLNKNLSELRPGAMVFCRMKDQDSKDQDSGENEKRVWKLKQVSQIAYGTNQEKEWIGLIRFEGECDVSGFHPYTTCQRVENWIFIPVIEDVSKTEELIRGMFPDSLPVLFVK